MPRLSPFPPPFDIEVQRLERWKDHAGVVGKYETVNRRQTNVNCQYFGKWHTFSVRCAASIAFGYRVTFVVRVLWAACLLMTPLLTSRTSAHCDAAMRCFEG